MDQREIVNHLQSLVSRDGVEIKSVDWQTGEVTIVLNGMSARRLLENEKTMVHKGKPLKAIKSVRDRLNCTIAEGKDIVEQYYFETFGEYRFF